MIKAIALDDKAAALRIIREFCSKIDFVHLQKTFTIPSEAHRYLNKFPVDLIFLAIQMPLILGIKFSKIIPHNTMIIFISSYNQYAVEAFDSGAVDYLLKPFSFERFFQSVKKAEGYFKFFHQKENSEQHHLFIRADYCLIKIAINDILYIESLDDYLKIHISNHKTVVSKMTMKAILEKLPPDEFIRVHRSFIIPLSKIKKIRKKIISLAEAEIPIGLRYKQNVKSVFLK